MVGWPAIAAVGATALGGLLGGGGGGTKVKRKPTMTPEQLELLRTLTGQIEPQIGEGVSWEGAPYMSDVQRQIYGQLPGMLTGEGDPLYGRGTDVLAGMMEEYDPAAEREYWESSIVNPAMRRWEQEVIPGLQERFVSGGALSSGAFSRALTRSGADLTADLQAQLGGLMFKGRSEAQRRQFEAAQAGEGRGLGRLRDVLGISGAETAAEMERFQAEQPYANPWLDYLGPALGSRAFENIALGQGPTTTQRLGSALGAGGSAYLSALAI